MKLTRKNLKEIVKEEVAALRKEGDEGLGGVSGMQSAASRMEQSGVKKAIEHLALKLSKLGTKQKRGAVVQLMKMVGITDIADVGGAAALGGAIKSASAPGEELPPEEEPLPPGSRY